MLQNDAVLFFIKTPGSGKGTAVCLTWPLPLVEIALFDRACI